jgi:hypothetical protein
VPLAMLCFHLAYSHCQNAEMTEHARRCGLTLVTLTLRCVPLVTCCLQLFAWYMGLSGTLLLPADIADAQVHGSSRCAPITLAHLHVKRLNATLRWRKTRLLLRSYMHRLQTACMRRHIITNAYMVNIVPELLRRHCCHGKAARH